eukprot:scaffold8593_cov106-Isochrysis_galbana.AAC.3
MLFYFCASAIRGRRSPPTNLVAIEHHQLRAYGVVALQHRICSFDYLSLCWVPRPCPPSAARCRLLSLAPPPRPRPLVGRSPRPLAWRALPSRRHRGDAEC